MSGHVFHPGHDDLHGITVALTGMSGRTYVGRWHERTARGVVMHDVAIHQPGVDPLPLSAWLDRQRKFGIAATERHLLVPADEAGPVAPLESAM